MEGRTTLTNNLLAGMRSRGQLGVAQITRMPPPPLVLPAEPVEEMPHADEHADNHDVVETPFPLKPHNLNLADYIWNRPPTPGAPLKKHFSSISPAHLPNLELVKKLAQVDINDAEAAADAAFGRQLTRSIYAPEPGTMYASNVIEMPSAKRQRKIPVPANVARNLDALWCSEQ